MYMYYSKAGSSTYAQLEYYYDRQEDPHGNILQIRVSSSAGGGGTGEASPPLPPNFIASPPKHLPLIKLSALI